MEISKEEWVAWKSSPCTKWFFSKINENLDFMKNELVEDRFQENDFKKVVGMCLGMKAVLEFKPEFTEESV